MAINDASHKLRNAANLLSPASAKSVYSYLEGDILRHLGAEHRGRLAGILSGIRNESAPGCPTWVPDVARVVPELMTLADEIAKTEKLQFTRSEFEERIRAAHEAGRVKALDGAAEALEGKCNEAFSAGLERGRMEMAELMKAKRKARAIEAEAAEAAQ
jgi:hypothetical protein